VVSATYATVFDEDELAFRDEIDAVVAAQPGLGRRQSFAPRGRGSGSSTKRVAIGDG
jgi:hypothetical protein